MALVDLRFYAFKDLYPLIFTTRSLRFEELMSANDSLCNRWVYSLSEENRLDDRREILELSPLSVLSG